MPGQVPPLRQFSTLSNRTVRFPNRMTPVPADVVEWLEERFPKPRVDSVSTRKALRSATENS